MAEYVLSERDYQRVQTMLRWYERERNLRDKYRRRNITVGGGSIFHKARIIQTLRRADEGKGITKINYYEIEFLNDIVEKWSSSHGTYYVGDIVKYSSDGIQLIYKCIQEHSSSSSYPPTNETYWEESTHLKAWIFGYSGDLLETIPWLQPDDIVKVFRYDDSRWTDRKWWILETAIRVQSSSNGGIDCSIAWNATDNRAMGVF